MLSGSPQLDLMSMPTLPSRRRPNRVVVQITLLDGIGRVMYRAPLETRTLLRSFEHQVQRLHSFLPVTDLPCCRTKQVAVFAPLVNPLVMLDNIISPAVRYRKALRFDLQPALCNAKEPVPPHYVLVWFCRLGRSPVPGHFPVVVLDAMGRHDMVAGGGQQLDSDVLLEKLVAYLRA